MNSIHRQIQPLNTQRVFNVNSIQRQIQPLNPQIGFMVNLSLNEFHLILKCLMVEFFQWNTH